MSRQARAALLFAASSALCICTVSAAIAADDDDAARAVSQLVSAASPGKESKQQFFQRVASSFRQIAATELMAQALAGDAWHSMTADQKVEFTQLYEKIVLATLHGAYDAVAPTRFTLATGDRYRSQRGSMKRRCDLLQMTDCIFYSAKANANDFVVEYQLIETARGWRLVDLIIQDISVHSANEMQIQDLLKLGPAHALERIRTRVSQY